MSALVAKVSAEHQAVGIVGGCACGSHPTGTISADLHRTRHLIAVAEAATRAAVAADIRATAGAVADYIAWYEENDARVWAETPDEAAKDILDRLARIAEGRQP